MCGIAGIVGSDDLGLMERVLKRLGHRGPDHHETRRFDPVRSLPSTVFGHSRLSIIDLSPAAHQPMVSTDGDHAIVFNGEIYNFAEIREELSALGHRFVSRSDTEVILGAYRQWGLDCLHKLNGMFAFAIFDRRAGRVVLVRDRIGIKPLYYARTSDGVAFASEIKALLDVPGVERSVDLKSLDQYATLGYTLNDRTLFKGVRRVPPGYYLLLDGETIRPQEYWRLPDHDGTTYSQEELVGEFHDLLVDSVRLQLVSDVPLGAFLSGGLDSSTIVAIMARELGVDRVKTFCVGFDGGEARHDERHYAAQLAASLGTAHTETICTRNDAVGMLPTIVWHLDEPVAEDVLPAYTKLCRIARENVTVALTGEGSDEFGYGYRFYNLDRLRQRWDFLPDVVRRGSSKVLAAVAPAHHLKKKALAYTLQDDEIAGFLVWSSLFLPEEKNRLWGDTVRKDVPDNTVEDELRQAASYRSDGGIDLVAWLEARYRLVDYLLLRTDRLSMASGLEARVPFLDHRLVEFMARVPAAMKIEGFTGKMLLRKAFENVLPPETTWRRKKPFAAPVSTWLNEAARTYLSQSRMVEDGIIAQHAVLAILGAESRDRKAYERQVWALAMLELWYRIFIREDLAVDHFPPPRPVSEVLPQLGMSAVS